MKKKAFILLCIAGISACINVAPAQNVKLNDSGYFESRGVEVHLYDGPEGIRIYQKDNPVALGGGVRVDSGPQTVESLNPNLAGNKLEIKFSCSDYPYYLKAETRGLGLALSVFLTSPLPENLEGKLSLGLDFVPGLYLGKNCIVDGTPGIIPEKASSGRSLVLCPEDDNIRISLKSDSEIRLEGSENALRAYSVVPSGKVGAVVEWYVEPSYNSRWSRGADLTYSHIGYSTGQSKKAVIEIDAKDSVSPHVSVYKVNEDGYRQLVYQPAVKRWGASGERGTYLTADISIVREPGVYCVEYDKVQSGVFPVSPDVYAGKWCGALEWLAANVGDGCAGPEKMMLSLADIWESFRPEADSDADGRPDVIEMLETLTRSLVDGNVFSSNVSAELRFARVSALAAAGRVLRGFSDELAKKAQSYADLLWKASGQLSSGNRLDAAIQMWYTTSEASYKTLLSSALSKNLSSEEDFYRALEIYPLMDSKFRKKFQAVLPDRISGMKAEAGSTPFGIPSLEGDELTAWALRYYLLWKRFPDNVDPTALLNALATIYGNHSYADARFLESLGTERIPDFVKLSLACERVAGIAEIK